ncbi:MAG TPA: nuclear transport factor 2 family protein [Dehalococcoidia bacterium]|nr:nuclear transport factor 2 family protein [Dehalococcoidia bacterium]
MIPDATKRTEAALKRYVAAIMAGDADSVMRNFADDAVVYTSEGPLHGQDAIRADIESFINNTPEGMRDNFEVVRRDIDGDFAYITWKAEPFVLMATETFVVTDDKIRVQTYLIMESRST